MPKQVQKSGLLKKLGANSKKTFSTAKHEEVKRPGGGEVPAGVETGIAKLVDCKFDTYKTGADKGKLYFYAAGVCVEPKKLGTLPIAGLRTSIMVPLCDTPQRKVKTEAEHLAEVMNHFKLLAGKEAVESLDGPEELEDLAKTLVESGVHFGFRTWKGKKKEKGAPGYVEKYDGKDAPEPRTNHTWLEAMDYEAGDEEDSVEDESEEAEEETEEEVEEEAEESEEEESEEDDGLDDLAAKAESTNKAASMKAKKELIAKAKESGYSQDEIDEAEGWEAVVELIRNPKEEEEESEDEEEESDSDGEEESEEEAEEEEASTPEVGSVYSYKPAGSKKAIKVEVVKVSAKSESVTLKDSAGKAILGKDKKPLMVPFDELINE